MKSGLIDKELEDDFFDELNLLRVALGNAGCEVTHQTLNIIQVATWYVNQTARNARTEVAAKPSEATLIATALAIQAGTTVEHVVRKAREMQGLLAK